MANLNVIDGNSAAQALTSNTEADASLKSLVGTNARRTAGVLHRNGITSADKLSAPGTITLAGTTGGSLTSGTTYYVSACAYNRWGPSTCATVVNASPGGSNTAMNVAFAQVSGADGYDLFLSTAAGAPLWVARITEAQRAAGGYTVTAVGTVTQSGTAAAGSVNINLVGTQLACTVAPFAVNNAYTPATVAGVGAVSCVGYSRAHIIVKLAVTDLRSLPTLTLVPFLANQVSSGDWQATALLTMSLLTAVGQPLEQDFELDIDGSTNLVVLIDGISGQGAAASVWIELA
jgi:hypothetical protein